MRAVVVDEYGSLDRVSIREVPDPAPKSDEVLVELCAVAVNYVDSVLISGKYQFRPGLPFIPGKLPAGMVRSVGENVSTLRPGDRVLVLAEYGGYAELLVAPATACLPIPDDMSLLDAASMSSVFDTALMSLRDRAAFQAGDSVLVLGATGGVGLAAIQLVKALGGRALAGILNPDKQSLAIEAGADAVINLSTETLKDDLREQVYSTNSGRGVDVVLDMLGGDFFDAAIRSLAWRGRLVVIGFAGGRIPTVAANYLLVKNITVSGIQISDYRRKAPQIAGACFAELFSLYVAGRIRPIPTTVLPLEKFQIALKSLVSRASRGRLVLLCRPSVDKGG